MFCQAEAHSGDAPVDHVDRDVGIEADHSSKKTRGSGSSGGSSGMPSGRKSRAPSSSRRANHASTSNGCFFSGSRITLSPTLLTRTSVPSKRNSLGRRTAWLRPCMKSLAVALMNPPPSELIDTNDIYHATSVSVNSSKRWGSRAPNKAPCPNNTAAPGKFRRVHHVLGPNLDVNAKVIPDRRQPAPLLIRIVAPSLLLATEPEVESSGNQRGQRLQRPGLSNRIAHHHDDVSQRRGRIAAHLVGGEALVSATDVDGFEQPGRALQRLLEIVHRLVGQPPLRIRQAVEDLQGRQFVAPFLEKALEAVDGIGRLPLVPALLCSEFAEAGPSPQPSKSLSGQFRPDCRVF